MKAEICKLKNKKNKPRIYSMTKTINENSFQKKKEDPRLLLLEQLVVIYITRFFGTL